MDCERPVKLSIVMPVYNAESYIADRLEELFSFDFSGTELIAVVCEDGACDSDKSAALCRGFLEGRQNAKVIARADEGLSVARNTGLGHARGEYVLFMDSDDRILAPGFQGMLKNAAADVVACKYALLHPNGRSRKPAYSFPKPSCADDARRIIYSKLPDSIWNVWRYVCRRSFLLENGLFFVPGLVCEDMEWTPRMLDKAGSIEFYDIPFYGYVYGRPGQLTKKASPKRTADVNRTVAESLDTRSPLLRDRLVREALFSVSDYCKFVAGDRAAVRPLILEAEKRFGLSGSRLARFYARTRRLVPLYWWSVALCIAKAARGRLKFALGPSLIRKTRGDRL